MKSWILLVAAGAVHCQTLPDPLTLPEALALAERADPQTQIASLRALEAFASARITSAGLGPQFSLYSSSSYQTSSLAGIGLTEFGLPTRVGPYRVFDARPRLTQTALDLSLLASSRAARLRAEAAETNTAAVAEQTRLLIIQLYLRALQAESRAQAAEARRVAAQAALDQAKQTFEAGTENRLAVVRAEGQIEREIALGIQAQRDRDTLATQLVKVMGYQTATPPRLEPIKEPAETTLEYHTLLKEALERRPELQAHQTRRRALLAEKESAERERLPKIHLTGEFGVFGQDPANSVSTWLIGGTVTLPLWTSKRIENSIKTASTRLAEWTPQRREMENAISQQIAQALVEREAAARALESARRQVTAAREALKLQDMRLEAGLMLSVDVVTAQSDLTEAEEGEIHARYERWLAMAALAHARGDVRIFLRAK